MILNIKTSHEYQPLTLSYIKYIALTLPFSLFISIIHIQKQKKIWIGEKIWIISENKINGDRIVILVRFGRGENLHSSFNCVHIWQNVLCYFAVSQLWTNTFLRTIYSLLTTMQFWKKTERKGKADPKREIYNKCKLKAVIDTSSICAHFF